MFVIISILTSTNLFAITRDSDRRGNGQHFVSKPCHRHTIYDFFDKWNGYGQSLPQPQSNFNPLQKYNPKFMVCNLIKSTRVVGAFFLSMPCRDRRPSRYNHTQSLNLCTLLAKLIAWKMCWFRINFREIVSQSSHLLL